MSVRFPGSASYVQTSQLAPLQSHSYTPQPGDGPTVTKGSTVLEIQENTSETATHQLASALVQGQRRTWRASTPPQAYSGAAPGARGLLRTLAIMAGVLRAAASGNLTGLMADLQVATGNQLKMHVVGPAEEESLRLLTGLKDFDVYSGAAAMHFDTPDIALLRKYISGEVIDDKINEQWATGFFFGYNREMGTRIAVVDAVHAMCQGIQCASPLVETLVADYQGHNFSEYWNKRGEDIFKSHPASSAILLPHGYTLLGRQVTSSELHAIINFYEAAGLAALTQSEHTLIVGPELAPVLAKYVEHNGGDLHCSQIPGCSNHLQRRPVKSSDLAIPASIAMSTLPLIYGMAHLARQRQRAAAQDAARAKQTV